MISLIISTRDRSDSLAGCLERARRLSYPQGGWELVVVDNGSTDGTAALLESLRPAVDGLILVNEPKPGLARARNAGVAASTGEFLAFTDDDCYVSPDFLVRVEERFSDPSIGFAGGRILLHDESDARIGITGMEEALLIPPGSLVPPGVIQGANFAVRRRALADAGGFDPGLGPGTPFNCEDVDCVSRISAAGWVGGFFPEVVVHHHHRRKPGSRELAALLESYARGRGAYYAKSFLEGRLHRGDVANLARSLRTMALDGRLQVASLELLGGCHYLLHRMARETRAQG
jgi:glycosyltransferase involved in cell wall biosynthesis